MSTVEQRLAELEDRLQRAEEQLNNHTGLDWGARGLNYPHPSTEGARFTDTAIYSTLNGPVGVVMAAAAVAAPASAAMTNSRITFVPFEVTQQAIIQKMAVRVGATSDGNLDVGIYTEDGLLVKSSGSTAMGSTSTTQTFTVATILDPGRYLMAVVCDSSTGTLAQSNLGGTSTASAGVLIQSGGGLPLPNQATFEAAGSALVPIIIASTRTLI